MNARVDYMTPGEEREHFARMRQQRSFKRDECGQSPPWLVLIERKTNLNHCYDSWAPDHPLPRIGERILCALPVGNDLKEPTYKWLDHVVTDIVHAMHPTNPCIWVYLRERTWWERFKEGLWHK